MDDEKLNPGNMVDSFYRAFVTEAERIEQLISSNSVPPNFPEELMAFKIIAPCFLMP